MSAACISDMMATPLAAAPVDKYVLRLHMSSAAGAKSVQHYLMLRPRELPTCLRFLCQSAAFPMPVSSNQRFTE